MTLREGYYFAPVHTASPLVASETCSHTYTSAFQSTINKVKKIDNPHNKLARYLELCRVAGSHRMCLWFAMVASLSVIKIRCVAVEMEAGSHREDFRIMLIVETASLR